MKIKIVNKSKHMLPSYSNEASDGMVLNSPGTIDADYRGEICVIIINLSANDFVISDGDRICQMIVTRHEKAEWSNVGELQETKRESGGFDHIGKK